MRITLLVLLLLFVLTPSFAQSNESRSGKPFVFKGYVKNMPALQFPGNSGEVNFMNFFHNRINFRWDINDRFHFAVEGRNRLLFNNLFTEYPGYADLLKHDPALMDLSWVWLNRGGWIGQTNVDRLYLDWQRDNWQIRAGRQRINWGVNMVSNPNDLFNTYSFFDFDYPERPGTDAIRIQHFFGEMSRLQIAVAPARNSKDMVAAAMLNLNRWNYDFQALAGYYHNRLALGGGWAGHIKGAGFKGEFTWFYDFKEREEHERANLVAAIGFDYMFTNGTFAILEFLYNGGYKRTEGGSLFMITQPLRADNIMFSQYAITLSASHQISNLISGTLSIMSLPDVKAAFLMPGIKLSVATNLDFELMSQIFAGGEGSVFKDAGAGLFLSLQYSF